MSTSPGFLKEMGITEWVSRNTMPEEEQAMVATEVAAQIVDAIGTTSSVVAKTEEKNSVGMWWFFGNKPQGDAELLFQNILRVLGLTPQEWSWKNAADKFNPELLPQDGVPVVAIAFGGATAQKLSGERDALPELRETVLAINADGAEELPLIATFELSQLISRPKDKALFWQDLLLAKSVLQSS